MFPSPVRMEDMREALAKACRARAECDQDPAFLHCRCWRMAMTPEHHPIYDVDNSTNCQVIDQVELMREP